MVKIENDYIPAPFTPGADIAGLLRIDSTHWQHGTNLHISMLATYHNPQTGANRVVSSPIRTTQVWNSARIFRHPTVSDSTETVATATASGVKYAPFQRTDQMYDTEFLIWSKDSQWVHISSHGALYRYDQAWNVIGVGGVLTFEHREDQSANEDLVDRDELIEAYESSSQAEPPANLVLQLSCVLENPLEDLDVAPHHYQDWARGWLAPVNMGVRDRCFIFYRGKAYTVPSGPPAYTGGFNDIADAFATEFYSKLAAGYQAWVARDCAAHESLDEFNGHYPNVNPPAAYDPSEGADNHIYFDWLRAMWPCLGDNCMTLTHVYLDDYSIDPSTAWHMWVTP